MGNYKKIIGIVFSDLHLSDWGKFSTRKDTALKVLKMLVDEASKYGACLIHCGDLFHKPESISQEVLQGAVSFLNYLSKESILPIVTISGNHDINQVSKIREKPLSWVSTLSNMYPNIKCIDYEVAKDNIHGVAYYGIPYVDHNVGLNDYIKSLKLNPKCNKHILLLHTDYPGAKDTDGSEVGSVENLNTNLLKKFDLVLIGHIHKPQKLGKHVYMVGAPYQQRRTDKNCKLGYWKLYSDLSMEFVLLEGFPRFIDVEDPEEVKEDGNYYTVIPKKVQLEDVNKHKITRALSKKRLAKRYMKAKGIKDKDKQDLLIKVLNKVET